jgi:hypothetical protein
MHLLMAYLFHRKLQEVAAGFGAFFTPKFDVYLAKGCGNHNLQLM